jgi:diadenosine tetraphosphatase ApaH/serine/threonine PP2A family protein phosphatase
MRALIISDVHANLEALTAVLWHARGGGDIDEIWVAGDIVGYGADPAAVIDELRAVGAVCVAGNHDAAACGLMDVDAFNAVAARAALWTRDELDGDHRAWLAGLPLVVERGLFTLVHGSLRSPEWEYLLAPEQASAHFDLQTTPYSMVGHSHIQFRCAESAGVPLMSPARDGETLTLGDTRSIVNPGSVGQPRDGDSRAGYILYDQDAATITWHRAEYDIERAAAKIEAAGLPRFLAQRLFEGR